MRAHLAGGGLGLLTTVWLIGCGSGGERLGCGQVCDKIVSCDLDTQENCLSVCATLEAAIAGAYFQQNCRCVLDTPCATLDTRACLTQAASTAPDTNLDRLLNTFCAKRITCQNDITLEQCLIQYEAMMGVYADMLRMLKDPVVTCLEDCINSDQVPCDSLSDPIKGQAAMDACSVQCNVAI